MSSSTDTISTTTVRAGVKHLHVSASKVRQVLALIRGLSADDAGRVLQLCQKDAAGDILKVLDSAIANAENNRQIPIDELYVARAYADEGPTRKWGQPRARGRYFRIRHRSSHVTIILARYSDDELEARRRRDETSSAGPRGRGTSRRRAERVRRSRAAQHTEEHDHDQAHDQAQEHEEDRELAEEIAPEVGPVGEEEIEATLERDEDLEEAAAEVAPETTQETAADKTPEKSPEESE
ncbi:MAG: large subunit ribosomal protein [Actinomycetota bacterium]|nr:large subunit ribosomal protein [Actinomycetota bacterium]